MKKNITWCLLLCLFVFACKKDHSKNTGSDSKTYKVNFNISGFTQQILNSEKKLNVNANSQSSSSLAGNVEVILYDVFDSANKLVHTITQTPDNTNFGTISDNLPAGNYTIVVVAGKDGLTQADMPPLTNIPPYSIYYIDSLTVSSFGNYQWKDTFYKKTTLTVTGSDVNQSITLDRIVSQLEVNIQDVIPANAKTITYTYYSEYFYFSLLGSVPVLGNWKGSNNEVERSFTLPDSVIGKTNLKFSYIVCNTVVPLTNVTINCYDASSKIIGQAMINNVTMQVNKKTILSGKLFGSQNSFNVSIDPVWDPSKNIIHF